MAPRYHLNKGYNKYNKSKLFDEPDSGDGQGHTPLIINKDFLNQRKRKIDLINDTVKPDIGSDIYHIQNEIGLEKAYNSPDYLYKDGDTLYIGGTQTARDVWDDLKIPFGLTRYSQRYMDADKVLQKDPEIKNLVGHSLAGSVALEFQKNHPERDYRTITYGAPVNSDNPSNERFRKKNDIVSFLDSGAQSLDKSTPDVGQHSYRRYT
jgi:hypothetical protein